MTSTVPLSLGASSTIANWDAIDWQPIKANVRRLQMRIAKAVRVLPGPATGLSKGLSRVTGNYHARFLGEGVAVRSLSYPTLARRFERTHCLGCRQCL
jgi:hypothetical protein